MGVYIKGMEMPKPGQIVLVEIDENGDVFAAYDGGRTKLTQHKAVSVPPHERLIDADALSDMIIKYKHEYALEAGDKKDFGIMQRAFGLHDAELMVDSCPTIIPADEGTDIQKEFMQNWHEDGE